MADKRRAPSVKSICEKGILAGSSSKVIMGRLKKQFPGKEEEVLSKSIRYYASALHRDNKIDDDSKAKYVGTAGRGNKAGSSKAIAKPVNRTPAKKESKTTTKRKSRETPAKKSSGVRTSRRTSGQRRAGSRK